MTTTNNDPIITMLATANSVAKDLRKFRGLDAEVASQQAVVNDAKATVAKALDGNADVEADAAFRAFKSANNRLDRLLEQSDDLRIELPDRMAALRDLVDDALHKCNRHPHGRDDCRLVHCLLLRNRLSSLLRQHQYRLLLQE